MDSVSEKQFMEMFAFEPKNNGLIGAERECFLVRGGKISPISRDVLSFLNSSCNGRSKCFGYELSACQLEDRLEKPCRIENLRRLLEENEQDLRLAEKFLGFTRLFCGTGPEDMPLDHYPCERYDRIVASMPRDVLKAACRVTGVHIHVGMPDHQTALRVYNKVAAHFPMLCRVGCLHFDGRLDQYQVVVDSFGRKHLCTERIRLFMDNLVNGAYFPPQYADWSDFYQRATKEGFASDPRRLWDFIRISRHGTIEFRMFDSTGDLNHIVFWASLCLSLCKS